MTLKQLTLKHNYIELPKERQERTKNENLSFCIRVLNLGLNSKLFKDENDNFYIRASLFDFNKKIYFGKQWSSSPLDYLSTTNDVASLECNQGIYFHTNFMDKDLAVIFEIIRFKTEDNQTSMGWSVLNLYKYMESITDLELNKKSDAISLEIYKGTPRTLLILEGFPETNPMVKFYEESVLNLNFNRHKAFNKCYNIIPEYFLVHDDDDVPGLEKDSEGYIDFVNPKLKIFHPYVIEKIKILINPSLIEFEKQLLEDINNDRIERDVSTPNKNPSSLTITERRLRVGVNNGLTYTEDNSTLYLNAQDPKLKKSSKRRSSSVTKEEINSLTVNNSVEISLPIDKEFSLVFILEYTISEMKTEKVESHGKVPLPQHTYQIRWINYKPFEEKLSPDTLKSGIRLDLEFSGGSDGAPENVLVYKSEMDKNKLAHGDEGSMAIKHFVKLFAIFREKPAGSVRKKNFSGSIFPLCKPSRLCQRGKTPIESAIVQLKSDQDPHEKEPTTSVTNASSLISDGIMEEKIDVKESKTLQEQPKPAKRKSKKDITETFEKSDEVSLQDTQVKAFQQFLYQQQQNPIYMAGSHSIPATMMGVPLPKYMINMWNKAQLGEDQINDYDSIDPYIMKNQLSTARGGNSSRMFPIQMYSHHGLGLSRAAYSKMHVAGFPDLTDYDGNHPYVIDSSEDYDRVINMNIEEKDHRQCNEIIFQFMALSRFQAIDSGMQTKTVFFTFQFYRFPVISTERLILDKIIEQISNYENSSPMILRKAEKSEIAPNCAPGAMIKFSLDPTFMKSGEMFGFYEYLTEQVLHIDVWDGDSLLHIGSCAVNLKNLCRQGRPSVQMTYELDIINQIEFMEENSVSIVGRLHFKMANLGSVPSNKVNGITARPHQRKGMLIDATAIERFSGILTSSNQGGSLRDIYNIQDIQNNSLNYTNIVVRPKPAVSKNRELSEMLEHHITATEDISLSPMKTPLVNEDILRGQDHDKAKKIERFKNTLRRLESDQFESNDSKLILDSKRSEKIEKLKVLQTIQCYREQQKDITIRKLLNGVIEKEITLYPKFGCTELFEVKIKNHFNVDTNVNIEINDSGNYLAPVVNTSELKALKMLFSVTTCSENDLINFNKEKQTYQIFLRSKETVLVPFKYTSMSFQCYQDVLSPALCSPVKHIHKSSSGELEYQIVFRTSENKLLSILRIKVIQQPPIINQTFRFFNPEQSFLKRLIRLPPLQVNAGSDNLIQTLSRCTDLDVLSECQPVPVGSPHDLHIKVPCGPAPQIRQFLIATYVDKYLLKPIQIWHFTIHSKSRIDVVAHQGRSTNMTLLLKGTSSTHHVQIYVSHPEELTIGSVERNTFTLTAHTNYELTLNLTPIKIGDRRFQVNVVDIDNRVLVRSWMICAICKEPEISKLFEIKLPLNGGSLCKKRIGFQNSYSYRKQFYLSTDRPDLMMLKDSILAINANEIEHIGMVFVPCSQRGKQKIYVFVNDEDGKNEETFALMVDYE